ncbi:DUF2272 domain-containing protein [Nisaea acidiphila]|uniref:DUF2272 domain-containing protein n=1 Tax=Nisaea acidiphila TaxID=1862145 RepID=A0A9J7ALH5_9PROT|nr:DUF2272 domain-containing protein [Nisaea acidiphila]UUX48328.1 DUF2272 domain-containing protein [Nisaea acidiphila]
MTFASALVAVAEREWALMGRTERDLDGRVIQAGGRENVEPYASRIGTYWRIGAGRDDLTGHHRDWPWSAAFVCFCMQRAGAGEAFPRTAGHATYIHKAVRAAKDGGAAPFIGHRPTDRAPAPGDILTYSRGDLPVDYDALPDWFSSHGDIVTGVEDGAVTVIGGNVSDAVTRRKFRLDGDGIIADPRLHWITVIANGLEDFAPMPAPEPAGDPHVVTANPHLRLRGLPDKDSEVVGTMPNGTLVYAGALSEGWAPIDMFGDGHVDGFAHIGYLKPA